MATKFKFDYWLADMEDGDDGGASVVTEEIVEN